MSIFRNFFREIMAMEKILPSAAPTLPSIGPNPASGTVGDIGDAIRLQPGDDPRDVQIEWLKKELAAAKSYGDNAWEKARENFVKNADIWRENQQIKMTLRKAIGELRNALDPEL